jgi:hypothetical protein
VNEILAHGGAGLISAEAEARLRARFKDLVPGKFEMPQGG